MEYIYILINIYIYDFHVRMTTNNVTEGYDPSEKKKKN